MARKKKSSPEIENKEEITAVNETELSPMEEISLEDLDSLEVYTEESAFLTDDDKGEIEALFDDENRPGEILSAQDEAAGDGSDLDSANDEDMETSEESAEENYEASSEEAVDEEITDEDKNHDEDMEMSESAEEIEGSELEDFDSAEIEELEFVEDERVESIVESILFATDKPISLNAIKLVFKGTNVKTDKIRRVIEKLSIDYASGNRGVY
ncbi:MAG: hypothetical protein KDD45_05140, partial [Bdellovibrionales bacterium]|nr:hypothetical protein [Bdellovibrionales bacterium]